MERDRERGRQIGKERESREGQTEKQGREEGKEGKHKEGRERERGMEEGNREGGSGRKTEAVGRRERMRKKKRLINKVRDGGKHRSERERRGGGTW